MVKLIKCIEKHPVLYATNHHEYAVRSEQDRAWKVVAKEVEESESLCRDRWRSIRACFGRHLRNKNSNRKPYYLSEYLDFLIPFTPAAKTITNSAMRKLENGIASGSMYSSGEESVSHAQDSGGDMYIDYDDIFDELYVNIYSEEPTVEMPVKRRRMSSLMAPDESNAASGADARTLTKVDEVVSNNDEPAEPADADTRTKINSADPDIVFFKSVLPEIARMSRKQKLLFKQTVISIISDILYCNDYQQQKQTAMLSAAATTSEENKTT